MTWKRLAPVYQQVISKHVELSLCDQTRIELPDRTGCGIAWICEPRLPLLFAFRVGLFKNFTRDEGFTTNFKTGIDPLCLRFETQRHTTNRARILRDVFTDPSVATRYAAHQDSILVLQRKR